MLNKPMLRTFLLSLFLFLPLSAREALSFNEGWRFHLGDPAGAEQVDFSDGDWKAVRLPHDWSIAGPVRADSPSGGDGGFFPTGIGWYRTSFDAPASWAEREVLLELEGVYMNSQVWLNGHLVGGRPNGYLPVLCVLSPHLKPGARNTLAVRVDNAAQPNSRWYSGSGIYRPVTVHVLPKSHFAPQSLFPQTTLLADASAVVSTSIDVANGREGDRVQMELFDARGLRHAVASAPVGQPVVARVAVPRLWSPESPTLYTLRLTLLRQGQILDSLNESVGLRTIAVDPERGFLLNGRPYKLRGGNVHHDHGPMGARSFAQAENRRVALLRAAGYNAVRTAHNAPSVSFLRACDRQGLLVMVDFFDAWEKAKKPHDYSVHFKEWWARDVDTHVRRDRAHPSVVLWNIGNEVYERGAPSGARIARDLVDRIRMNDTTRPVTAGINGMGEKGDWTKTDGVFNSLDVAGYNYEIVRHADDRLRHPQRLIVATESYQNEAFLMWDLMERYPYIIGDFVWSTLDYLGEAGIGRVFTSDQTVTPHWIGSHFPWHGGACGDIDILGQRKPWSYYRSIVWDQGQKLYAGVAVPSPDGQPWKLSQWSMPPLQAHWNWTASAQPLALHIFSRLPEFEVRLNGKLLHSGSTSRVTEFKAVVQVPYTPGTLEIRAGEHGVWSETQVWTTAGPAVQGVLLPEPPPASAVDDGLRYFAVEARDAAGVPCPDEHRLFTVEVFGPAELLGVGNGDLTQAHSYAGPTHAFHQGRAQVIVRTTGQPGTVTVRLRAEGLPLAEQSFSAR